MLHADVYDGVCNVWVRTCSMYVCGCRCRDKLFAVPRFRNSCYVTTVNLLASDSCKGLLFLWGSVSAHLPALQPGATWWNPHVTIAAINY